jgi:haloalkane dehalogenase
LPQVKDMTIIEALRTPEDRFADLPGFSFEPHYLPAAADGLRMHYIDEGVALAGDPVFLCLHGQPSWSYLYRKMIPVFAEAGRAIALDLFGFGRSDKPIDQSVHSFDFHRASLIRFVEMLDLTNITLVCQDWGGLLGLTVPMEMPERFSRLIVMNTSLATGEMPPGPGFAEWQAFNRSQPDLDIAALMQRASPEISLSEAQAYAAPFPDARYKAAVRAFPDMVPSSPDAPGAATSRAARDWWSNQWQGQSFMAVGCQDRVITPAAMEFLRTCIRGCPAPMLIEDGGHFVQERGDEIAHAALASFD